VDLVSDFLSKSKILTYCGCPKRYMFLYVNKIPQAEGIAMIRGKQIHAFMEYFFNDCKIENGQLILPKVSTFLDKKVDACIPKILNFEKSRWETCVKHKGLELAPKYYFPVLVEKKVEIPALGINGIVDRVDRCLDDDGHAVIEIKTGHENEMSSHILFELKYYKYLLEKGGAMKEGDITKGIVWFPEHNRFFMKKLEDDGEIADVVKEVQSNIANKKFGRAPHQHCEWCEFKAICMGN
jgi:CRISPR/Cas system-associated exonuclease Cas4 (RecB family)